MPLGLRPRRPRRNHVSRARPRDQMDVAGDRMRNAALPVIRMIPSSTRLLCPSVSAWINLPSPWWRRQRTRHEQLALSTPTVDRPPGGPDQIGSDVYAEIKYAGLPVSSGMVSPTFLAVSPRPPMLSLSMRVVLLRQVSARVRDLIARRPHSISATRAKAQSSTWFYSLLDSCGERDVTCATWWRGEYRSAC
jgi:hypothetical protein